MKILSLKDKMSVFGDIKPGGINKKCVYVLVLSLVYYICSCQFKIVSIYMKSNVTRFYIHNSKHIKFYTNTTVNSIVTIISEFNVIYRRLKAWPKTTHIVSGFSINMSDVIGKIQKAHVRHVMLGVSIMCYRT